MSTKKRTNEEFLKELKTVNPNYIPLERYINNHTKIMYRCAIHDVKFLATPRRVLEGRSSCPKCNAEDKRNRSIKENEVFLKELTENKIYDVIPLEEYKGHNYPMLFKCSCGDNWTTTPARVLLGNHCKKCGYKKFSGDKNHFYNPNLTEEERNDPLYRFRSPEYAKFRDECFVRDSYTCRISGKVSTGDIVVHHLDGYNWSVENRTNIYNGITLNKKIHKTFHSLYGKGNNTKEQFLEFIENLYDKENISYENLKSIKNQISKIK